MSDSRAHPDDWRARGDRRHRTRLEANAESVSLRLVSRLSSTAIMVVVIPLAAWFASGMYDLVMAQLRANTMALEENQSFIQGMVTEQSLQGAELEGVNRDISKIREGQSRMWVRYNNLSTKVTRLNTLHESQGEPF